MKQFTHTPEDCILSGMNIKEGMYIRAENWDDFVEVTGIEICKIDCNCTCHNKKIIAISNHKLNVSMKYCQTTAPWIVKGE